MDKDILRQIMILDGVEEPEIDRYFARMESQAAAMVRQIEGGLASVEHVEPNSDASDTALPPAVRALMADRWQRLLDAEPISESR
jgi:hypothetical protein